MKCYVYFGGIVCCLVLGGWILGLGLTAQPTYPSQSWFLSHCAEDEVIAMDARFGPNEVGCVHIDELQGEHAR